ncbi:MAG: hypothetical protein WBF99_05040 [Xanthobacteraceae bacterium]
MTDPAPATASTAYDLYYLQNGKRFFWRNPNRGVTLFDAGRASAIIWRNEAGEAGRQLWTDIAAINMSSGSDGKDVVNACLIRFRDGRTLTVTDAGPSGQVDHDRTPPYRDFVRALHRRLAAAPQGTIRFTAGFSENRHTGMVAILFIAALFFIGTPLVLLFIVRDWRVLGVLAAGIGFVWPFWKVAENNRPRPYDPRHPPGELMD